MCNVIKLIIWIFATQAHAKHLVVNLTDNAQNAMNKQVGKFASKLVERALEASPLDHKDLENTIFAKTSSKSWSAYSKAYRGTQSSFTPPARTMNVPSGDIPLRWNPLRPNVEYNPGRNTIMGSNTFGNSGIGERPDWRSRPTLKAAVQDKIQEKPLEAPEKQDQERERIIQTLETLVQQTKNGKAEKTIQRLQQQAPLLSDFDLVSDGRVSYSSPLEYQYVKKGLVKTEDHGVFSSMLPGRSFIDLTRAAQQRLLKISGEDYTTKVIQSFTPEPNVLTCMWEVHFIRGGRRAIVAGSSTYSLDEYGKVSSIQETWQTKSDKVAGRNRVADLFLDSLAFQLSRRPRQLNFEYSPEAFIPAYKYASWEALKNVMPTREQADKSSMPILSAFMGISGGVYLSSLHAIAMTLQSMFEAAKSSYH